METCDTRGGCVLGPLLFTIHKDNVTTHIRHSNFHPYADDQQIYHDLVTTDMPNAINLINLDLTVVKWAYRHA